MSVLAITLVATLAVTMAVMFAVWLASVWMRDVSIVDIYWGPGFAVIAWVALVVNGGGSDRGWLAACLVSVWGLRLGGYLWMRNHGKGEDYRYAAMRRRHGEKFASVSLYSVFGLQAALMWIVSFPLQATQVTPAPALGLLDVVGVALFAVGLAFEAVGDYQLAQFKSDPANEGVVMDRGLWAWTRHPNYFGDFTLWWGFGCLAASAGAWWTLVGPMVMSVFLIRISGAALLERGLTKTKPKYADYIARTSGFFPMPPGKAA